MFRAPSEDVMKNVHIDSLKQRFPNTTQINPSTYLVEDNGSSTSPGGAGGGSSSPSMSLYVVLPQDFPSSPPQLTSLSGRPLMPSPASSSASESKTSSGGNKNSYNTLPHLAWTSNTMLAEYAEAGIAYLRVVWGNGSGLCPASMADVPDLTVLPADVLLDLTRNPFCLESYVYQVPYAKKIRGEINKVVDEVEKKAMENMKRKPKIEQLTQEIQSAQSEIQEHTTALDEIQKEASLLVQFGTHEGLLKSYIAEANAIKEQSQLIAQGVSTMKKDADVNELDVALEEYTRQRKLWHVRDSKRRAFLSSKPTQQQQQQQSSAAGGGMRTMTPPPLK